MPAMTDLDVKIARTVQAKSAPKISARNPLAKTKLKTAQKPISIAEATVIHAKTDRPAKTVLIASA